MINWNYLETFAFLSENLSFSQTAKQLNTSQPVISRQIANLEHSLGYPLFIRSKKTVRLSPQGLSLKTRLNPLVAEMNHLLLATEYPTDLFDTQIRFGSMFEAGRILLLPQIKSLMARHPRLRVSFQLSSSATIEEQVFQGQLDFGFVHTPSDRKSLHKFVLAEDPPVLIGPSLFDKKWSEKTDFEVIGYREVDTYLERFLQKNVPKSLRSKMLQKFSINSHAEIIDLIRHSQNKIAVMPLSSARQAIETHQVRLLIRAKTPQPLYLITHVQTLNDKRKKSFYAALVELCKKENCN